MSVLGEYIQAKYICVVFNTMLNTIQHKHATYAQLSITTENHFPLSHNDAKNHFYKCMFLN